MGGWGDVGLVHKKAQQEIERMDKKWIEAKMGLKTEIEIAELTH